jgi:hypothetical protein
MLRLSAGEAAELRRQRRIADVQADVAVKVHVNVAVKVHVNVAASRNVVPRDRQTSNRH